MIVIVFGVSLVTGWLAGTLHIPPLLFSLFSAHHRTQHMEMQKVKMSMIFYRYFTEISPDILRVVDCIWSYYPVSIFMAHVLWFAVYVVRCSQVIDNGLWLNNNKDPLIDSPMRWFQSVFNYNDIFIILTRLVGIQ